MTSWSELWSSIAAPICRSFERQTASAKDRSGFSSFAAVAGYRIVRTEGPGENETLRLYDRRGRVVTTVPDFHARLLDNDKVRVTRIGNVPTIVLKTWTGGAHGSDAYFVWSLGRRPRCLLAYDKGNVAGEHDFDLADLDGDGMPEVRSWYDGSARSCAPTSTPG